LNSEPSPYHILRIEKGNEAASYDTLEQFFMEYLSADDYSLTVWTNNPACRFSLRGSHRKSIVTVEFPDDHDIKKILSIFEREKEKISPRDIFISHGHDEQWIKLRDTLHHQFKYQVTFYENDTHAGRSIQDVLETMLKDTDIALIVFTGEVADKSGIVHARDNVIHELGFCQGRLGFENVILLLEEGVYEPSNVHGINQIRFPKGRLVEKHADIVANIKRLRKE
jgi:predicted nucleotide-binding protein